MEATRSVEEVILDMSNRAGGKGRRNNWRYHSDMTENKTHIKKGHSSLLIPTMKLTTYRRSI
eukprot:scaffold8387_cov94-Skeletonema_dohrnii-CCMP3373.AAC.1